MTVDAVAAASGQTLTCGWHIKPWGSVKFCMEIAPRLSGLMDALKADGIDAGRALIGFAKAGGEINVTALAPVLLKHAPLLLDLVRVSTDKADDEIDAIGMDGLVEVIATIIAVNIGTLANFSHPILAQAAGIGQALGKETKAAAQRKVRRG